ncbi:hypothetical protein MMC19_000630 [Ptychographa xylographoides]|nr:hypothetical protein [Ptychographa xylographoides]
MATHCTDTRYHHYIPQFLLRNFAHPQWSPKKGKGKGKNKQAEHKLNAIRLSGDKVEIVETPVRKTFGVQDLYLDTENPQNPQHIEEMLGRLEGSAARVIQKIADCFEKGKHVTSNQVTLTRTEKDILRKFLFVMRYRKDNIKADHEGETMEDYLGPDKEELAKYIRKRGFKRPLDVWLDNLRAFAEIRIESTTENWKTELMKKAYPSHAQLFIIHLDSFYLAFCTPAHSEDEFLMTENGFGVLEGPVTMFTDLITKQTRGVYTEYHTFAHISPKLSMVLRSQTLPLPVEDAVDSIKSMRESLHKLSITPHNLPEGTDSFLQELPVTKARNSYTKLEHGTIVTLDGGPPVRQSTDKFFFKFFPISTEFMNRINCVLLEQAYSTSMIVFNKRKSAYQAIGFYLTLDAGPGWKEVKGVDDPMLIYLKKLEKASILLGQKVIANYQSAEGRLFLGHSVLGKTDQVFDLVNTDQGAMETYNMLRYVYAKSANEVKLQSLDREDFEIAAKMLKLRIKIDTRTKGLDEQMREDARDNLREFYCERPPHQVWIYMKRIRFMKNGGTFLGPGDKVIDSHLPAKLLPGPEDIIAHSK